MMSMIENKTPIDMEDPQYGALLDDLQGNILKGHGREHVYLRLIEFTSPASEARRWIRAFGRGSVTSALKQSQQIVEYQGKRTEKLFCNLFLTRRGYEYIEISHDKIPPDPKFWAGMADSHKTLKDPPSTWEHDPNTGPIHAMALMAVTNPLEFQQEIAYIDDSLSDVARVIPQEGHAYRDNPRDQNSSRYLEHFGYLDGRSQPLFFQDQVDHEENLDGSDDYDPFAPLSLALVKDPSGHECGFGSYLVYRKLEQDVRGFKERERMPEGERKSLADELGIKTRRERVGAMVIGRFEDGTPVALSDHSNLRSAPNNFNYNDDPEGLKCPLFAHIRKMNPRTPESRIHRIVRRGMTYEDAPRTSPPTRREQRIADMPRTGVGLLFMCFQSNIEAQFEYLQKLANDVDLPTAGVGLDPLVGQGSQEMNWPIEWGKDRKLQGRFGNFVTLKGGEYFFAPCRSFFEGLPR